MSDPIATVEALPAPAVLEPARAHRFRVRLAPGVGGTIEVPVVVVAGADPGPTICLVAGVHGDEYDGILALLALADELDATTLRGHTVIVPVANPLAFRAGARRTPSDWTDMNRVFPGNPGGTVTERLADLLLTRIVAGADLVVTLHGWFAHGMTLPFVEYAEEAGATEASRAAAVSLGLPFVEGLPPDMPGRFLTAAAAAGLPTIEAEVGGNGTTTTARRALYRAALANVMRHAGIAPGGSAPAEVSTIERRIPLVASAGGPLETAAELGDEIGEGDPVGIIRGPHGEVVTRLDAPADGTVGMLRTTGVVEAGDHVAHLFVTRPL